MSVKVDVAAVISKLQTSRASMSNWTGIPRDKRHDTAPAGKVARALGCTTKWLLDLLAGRDVALSTSQAAHFLGLEIHSLHVLARKGHSRFDPRYSPMVRVGRTLRWSRNQLQALLPATSPLAGSPDSNVLTERGWECES